MLLPYFHSPDGNARLHTACSKPFIHSYGMIIRFISEDIKQEGSLPISIQITAGLLLPVH